MRKGGENHMIKKKIITALTVAAVFVASVMPVCASSPSTGNTGNQNPTSSTEIDNSNRGQMSSDGQYTVTNNADGSLVAAVQNLLLNNLAATGNAFGNNAIVSAATNAGQKVTAKVLAAGDIEPNGAQKDADGFYTVTLSVPGVAAGDTIAVLHKGANGWETIIPTVVANGSVTFRVKSFSPFAIVKLVVSGAVNAPQTGSDMFAVYALALMGVAGAAYCGKKYLAK
jgi:hypothetical protein